MQEVSPHLIVSQLIVLNLIVGEGDVMNEAILVLYFVGQISLLDVFTSPEGRAPVKTSSQFWRFTGFPRGVDGQPVMNLLSKSDCFIFESA
jgi:hypothetical protein